MGLFIWKCPIFFVLLYVVQLIITTMSTRRQKKIDDFYLRAFDEMFRRVGFDGYDKAFTEKPYWFIEREWTLEEDVNFTKWFIDEYKKTFRCPLYTAKGAAGMFVFNYGWKIKQEHQIK